MKIIMAKSNIKDNDIVVTEIDWDGDLSVLPQDHINVIDWIKDQLGILDKITITHFGAALFPEELEPSNDNNPKIRKSTLTWSSSILEITREDWTVHKILIDFGIFQWLHDSSLDNFELPFDLEEIDAVIITHAHMDHIWRLPLIAKYAREKELTLKLKVWMSDQTWKCAYINLRDWAKIQEKSVWVDSIRKEKKKLNKEFSMINNLIWDPELQQIYKNLNDFENQLFTSFHKFFKENISESISNSNVMSLFNMMTTISEKQKDLIDDDFVMSFLDDYSWSKKLIREYLDNSSFYDFVKESVISKSYFDEEVFAKKISSFIKSDAKLDLSSSDLKSLIIEISKFMKSFYSFFISNLWEEFFGTTWGKKWVIVDWIQLKSLYKDLLLSSYFDTNRKDFNLVNEHLDNYFEAVLWLPKNENILVDSKEFANNVIDLLNNLSNSWVNTLDDLEKFRNNLSKEETNAYRILDLITQLFPGKTPNRILAMDDLNEQILEWLKNLWFEFRLEEYAKSFETSIYELSYWDIEKLQNISKIETTQEHKETLKMNFEYFKKLFPEEDIVPSKLIKFIDLRNKLSSNKNISLVQLRKIASDLGIDKWFDQKLDQLLKISVRATHSLLRREKIFDRLWLDPNQVVLPQEVIDKLFIDFPELAKTEKDKEYILWVLLWRYFDHSLIIWLETKFPDIFRWFSNVLSVSLKEAESKIKSKDSKDLIYRKLVEEKLSSMNITWSTLSEEFQIRANKHTPNIFDILKKRDSTVSIIKSMQDDWIFSRADIKEKWEELDLIHIDFELLAKFFPKRIPNDIKRILETPSLLKELLIKNSGKIYDKETKAKWISEMFQEFIQRKVSSEDDINSLIKKEKENQEDISQKFSYFQEIFWERWFVHFKNISLVEWANIVMTKLEEKWMLSPSDFQILKNIKNTDKNKLRDRLDFFKAAVWDKYVYKESWWVLSIQESISVKTPAELLALPNWLQKDIVWKLLKAKSKVKIQHNKVEITEEMIQAEIIRLHGLPSSPKNHKGEVKIPKISQKQRQKIISDLEKSYDGIKTQFWHKVFNIDEEVSTINWKVESILDSWLTTNDIRFFRALDEESIHLFNESMSFLNLLFENKIPSDIWLFVDNTFNLWELLSKTKKYNNCYVDLEAEKIIKLLAMFKSKWVLDKNTLDKYKSRIGSHESMLNKLVKLIWNEDIDFQSILANWKKIWKKYENPVIREFVENKVIQSDNHLITVKSIFQYLIDKGIKWKDDLSSFTDNDEINQKVSRLHSLIWFVPSDFSKLLDNDRLLYRMIKQRSLYWELKDLLHFINAETFVSKSKNSTSKKLFISDKHLPKYDRLLEILWLSSDTEQFDKKNLALSKFTKLLWYWWNSYENFELFLNDDLLLYEIIWKDFDFSSSLKSQNIEHLISETHNSIKQLSDSWYKNIQSIKDAIKDCHIVSDWYKNMSWVLNVLNEWVLNISEGNVSALFRYIDDNIWLENLISTKFWVSRRFNYEVDKVNSMIERLISGNTKWKDLKRLLYVFKWHDIDAIKWFYNDREIISDFLKQRNHFVWLNSHYKGILNLKDQLKALKTLKLDMDIFSRVRWTLNYQNIQPLISDLNYVYTFLCWYDTQQLKKLTDATIKQHIISTWRRWNLHKDTTSFLDMVKELSSFNKWTWITKKDDIEDYFGKVNGNLDKLKDHFKEIRNYFSSMSTEDMFSIQSMENLDEKIARIVAVLEQNPDKFWDIEIDSKNVSEILQRLVEKWIVVKQDYRKLQARYNSYLHRYDQLQKLIWLWVDRKKLETFGDLLTEDLSSNAEILRILFKSNKFVLSQTDVVHSMIDYLAFMSENNFVEASDIKKYVWERRKEIRKKWEEFKFVTRFLWNWVEDITEFVKNPEETVRSLVKSFEINPWLVKLIKNRSWWYDRTSQAKKLSAMVMSLWRHKITKNSDIANYKKEKLDKILFTLEDVEDVFREYVKYISFNQEKEILPWVHVKLLKAWHVMWAAQAQIAVFDGRYDRFDSKKSFVTWLFSWDLGRTVDNSILSRHWLTNVTFPIWTPDIPKEHLHWAVVENTYNNRIHTPIEVEDKKFIDAINETCWRIWDKNWILWASAFMYQRTQDILLKLYHFQRLGFIWRHIKVYLDWPTAYELLKVFADCYDVYNVLFDWENLVIMEWPRWREKLLDMWWPAIVLATWWMMPEWSAAYAYTWIGRKSEEDGKSVMIDTVFYNPSNFIASTWYNSEWTPGRTIMDVKFTREKQKLEWTTSLYTDVILKDRILKVWAKVDKFSFSSHIDQRQLHDWLRQLNFVEWAILDMNHWEPDAIIEGKKSIVQNQIVPSYVKIVEAVVGNVITVFERPKNLVLT